MNFLSIDTSSTICSITFCNKSKYTYFEKENVREHTKLLGPVCKDILNNKLNTIDFIALSIGPGSYTGLKTSCSFAKGLAFAISKPIIPVCTFDGINYSIKSKGKYYIALYSHRDYAFYQLFKDGNKSGEPKCSKISNMKNSIVFGYGFKEILENNYFEKKPSSKNIGMIAKEKYNNLSKVSLNDIQPIFLSVGEKK